MKSLESDLPLLCRDLSVTNFTCIDLVIENISKERKKSVFFYRKQEKRQKIEARKKLKEEMSQRAEITQKVSIMTAFLFRFYIINSITMFESAIF